MTNRVDWRLGDWAAEYLLHCRVAKNLSPHSLRAYAIDLQDFELWYGTNRALGEVDRSDIRGFLAYLTGPKELAPASVKRRIACLKSFFKWAELEGGVEITPFHRLDLRLRLPKRLPRALEKEDIERLRRQASVGLVGRDGAVDPECCNSSLSFDHLSGWVALELLYATAVRVSELCSMQAAPFDAGKFRGVNIAGKGSRERWVPLIDGDLLKLLRTYVTCRRRVLAAEGARTPEFLITSRATAQTPCGVRAHLARLSKAAGFQVAVTPHVIRHSAATQYLISGLDLRHTQRLLGHSSVSTTEIYTAVSDRSLEDAMQRAVAK